MTVSDYGSLKATYNYTSNGARSSLVYSNGTSEHYTYNLANWLTHLENRSGLTVISAYDYTYYADGNQRTKTDHTNRVTTYAYDGAGRLTSENESTGFGAMYQYDRFSNRSTMAVSDTNPYTMAYTYDANNRLTQDVKTAGSAVTTGNYFYDPNGNQLAKATETLTPAGASTAQVGIDPSGVELYDYDAFNRMVRSNVNGEVAEYTYRADGLRNSKETAAGKTTHLWDGSNIAADMDGSAVVARYVRGIGLLLSDDGTAQKFYLYNGHGDVVQLTNSSGAVVKSYDYDAFGVERDPDVEDANVWRYCGEYFDRETGSIYLRARYYNPVLGRFRTEDPIRNGLNLYAYCFNDPINYIDPSGLVDVPLRSYMAMLSGNKAIIDWNPVTRGATVTWGGVTRTYYGNINTEGIMLIDEAILLQAFGSLNPSISAPSVSANPNTVNAVTKDTPPAKEDGYVAPKGGPVQGKDQNGNSGWVDKNGNVWVPVPAGSPNAHGGEHWDVQRKGGNGYANRYPGGYERAGSGKRPNIPAPTRIYSDQAETYLYENPFGDTIYFMPMPMPAPMPIFSPTPVFFPI
jgi:RHS repeat-associated protein